MKAIILFLLATVAAWGYPTGPIGLAWDYDFGELSTISEFRVYRAVASVAPITYALVQTLVPPTLTGEVSITEPSWVYVTAFGTNSLESDPSNVILVAALDIPLAAEAVADIGKTITGVSFYRGASLLTNDTAAPYGCTDTDRTVGTYQYYAVATDSSSVRATNMITVHVALSATNLPPSVTLTSPTNGATFVGPLTIPLAASASDNVGVSNVSFYRTPGGLIYVDASAPYTATNLAVAVGDYAYYAVADDGAGLRSTNSVTVHVISQPGPVVNAGPDQTIILPAGANLTGYSTNCVSNLWTKVSGSGTATFANAAVTNTSVTFSAAGTYGLRLTGYGSATNTASDDMVMTVMSNAPSGTVSIPIYLDGIGQPSQSRSVTLSGVNPAQTNYLQLLVHHASIYPNSAPKMTVSVNGSTAIPILNSVVNVLPYFGRPDLMHKLGGAYEAMWIEVPIPPGVAVNGQNSINFQHTFPAGTVTARTLITIPALNWRSAGGAFLMTTNGVLVEQDVLTGADYVTSGYNDTSVANGKTYFQNTITTYPDGSSTTQPCAGCHTWTGWDMSYFSFPRVAVIGAAKRFGASDLDANNIYNYIWKKRATETNSYGFGRVWNPPYQPGPGLLAKPVRQWAAGAGLNAIVNSDYEMFPDLFGGNTVSYQVVTNAYAKDAFSTAEQRINIPLPSIYHWYPKYHPYYSYTSFRTSDAWKIYNGDIPCNGVNGGVRAFASALSSGLPVYPDSQYGFNVYWHGCWCNFLLTIRPTAVDNPTGRRVTDFGNWHMIKTLEMMQEFGLESKTLPSTARDSRQWFDFAAFDLAPNILNTPYGADGLNDGTSLMKRYFTVAWYQVQISLNPGNYSDGIMKTAIRPMDWPYAYGFFLEMSVVEDGVTSSGMWMQNVIKAFQCQDFTTGKLDQTDGWSPQRNASLSWLVTPTLTGSDGLGLLHAASDIPDAQFTAFYDALTRYWLMKCKQFTPAKYYASPWGGSASWSGPRLAEHPNNNGYNSVTGEVDLPEEVWFILPEVRRHGVSTATINDLKAWATSVWPAANWSSR